MKLVLSKALVAVIATLGVALVANAGSYKSEKSADIVDVAVSAGQFETRAAALEAAEVGDTLKDLGDDISEGLDNLFGN